MQRFALKAAPVASMAFALSLGLSALPVQSADAQEIDTLTRAKQLLLDNRESLDKLAVMLCEKETVTAEEFAQILNDSKVSISEYTVYA